MFPYFYPTTVALIDDDQRFLESFEDLLRQEFLVRRFDNAQHGLNHLIGADADHISRIARLGGYANSDAWPRDEVDRLQLLLSSYVGQLRGYAKRFEAVSVAVIDLNMPGVDGLMICRALRRRPVRTILLTGNATERVALAAFNEGVIDRFVSKHEPNLIEMMCQHIRDLQNAYFRRITTTIRDALTLRFLSFLTEGRFLRYFTDLCAERNIVEYYVRVEPPGVDLIRADGRYWALLVLSPEEIERRIVAARAADADPALIARMEDGSIIAQFPSEGGLYEPRFRESWQLYVFDAVSISGSSRWLTTLVHPTAIRPIGLRDFVCLDEYMNAADSA